MFSTVPGNVAKDILGAFDEYDEHLWQAIADAGGKKSGSASESLQLEMTVDGPELLGEEEMTLATVRQHKRLADTSVGPEKRLMEVQLPEDRVYQAGDYLVVLLTNHQDDFKRIPKGFSVPLDALIKLSCTTNNFLPQQHAEYSYGSRLFGD